MLNRFRSMIQTLGLAVIFVGVVLAGSGVVWANVPQVHAFVRTLPEDGLRVVRSDERGLLLELVVPDYTLNAGQISVPNADRLAESGKPELPQFSALIGIPAEGAVSVQVVQDEVQVVAGQYSIAPAPSPFLPDGDLQPGAVQRIPDRTAYANRAWYPAEVARVADTAWLRDQHLARIEIYPFQYRAATQELRWHRRLLIEVKFAGAAVADRLGPSDANPFEASLQEQVLNYAVARQWRSTSADRSPAVQPALSATALAPRYKIVVDHDGVYRVTYDDLLAAGFVMTSFDPRNLHMTNQGLDVAVEVVGEGDGHFDPGDDVLFYGQKLRGDLLASKHAAEVSDWPSLHGWQPEFNAKMVEKYTDDNVYWLEPRTTLGLRMAVLNGVPAGAPVADYYTATVRAEQSRLWKTTHFNSEDTWFWDEITTPFSGYTVTRTYTITLTDIASAPLSATVRAELTPIWPNTPPNPTYRSIFRLNELDTVLEDSLWTGIVRHHMAQPIAPAQLLEGQNALILTVVAQPQTPVVDLFFDWFEIQYARRFMADENQLTFVDDRSGARQYVIGNFTTNTLQVFNVSNPWEPQRVVSSSITSAAGQVTAAFQITASVPVTYFVSGADQIQSPKQISRYVPPDLSGGNGADYLIITHRDFITSMQTLAAHRAAEGLRVKIVDVDDLYNQFNDGLYHPIAIKNFLKYAYANWQAPAPTYVLLVGDGHWNFKNFNPAKYGTLPNFMPPNLGWVDPYQGEVDTANALVMLVGSDPLPDMLVGRLPVNTAAEADIVVNKIISYEAQAKSLPYRRRMTLVADNIPDFKNSGDFVQLSNDLIRDMLPTTYFADKVYANDYGCIPQQTPVPCPAVNAAITATINQTGALFVNYIGHASVDYWGDERFLSTAEVATFSNANQLPIILSMTCLDGYWLYPNRSSLTETMLRAANGGAVATFSPTGLGVSTGHDRLERGLLNAVFQQGASRLGSATQAGKLALYASGQDYDLIDTFTVFGDPALRLPLHQIELSLAQADQIAARGSTAMYTLHLTNTALLADNIAVQLVQDWPAVAWPTSVALAPGAAATVVVSVTVPSTVTAGAVGVVTVTTQSVDVTTRATVQLNTTAFAIFYRNFLPVVRKN